MADLNEALTIIECFISKNTDDDIEVEQHPGKFTEQELGRILKKKKAVRISLEGFPQMVVTGDGIRKVEAQFMAFVICSDVKGQDRHKSALDIIQALAKLIVFARWEKPETFTAVKASDIAVLNLYSGDLDGGKGIAWWSISWTQGISIN
jgi:hypothetical protein